MPVLIHFDQLRDDISARAAAMAIRPPAVRRGLGEGEKPQRRQKRSPPEADQRHRGLVAGAQPNCGSPRGEPTAAVPSMVTRIICQKAE